MQSGHADRARTGFPWALLAVGAVGASLLTPILASAEGASDASSSRTAREEAVRAIPWQQLAPRERQVVRSVIDRATIYRRLPTRVIDCDPDMFTFLVQHPEVVVDVWQVMGISRVQLDKQPDGAFRGSDGAGTDGTVRYLFSHAGQGGQNTALVLAEGSYDGKPFLAPLRAKTVVLLQSSAAQERNGRFYVTVRADSFVLIEQMAVDLVARTVQPWVNATADRNYTETLSFVSSFSRTAERNPDGMKRLADRLAQTDGSTRDELVALCYRAAERYAQVEHARRTGAVSDARTEPVLVKAAPLSVGR